VQVEGAGLCRGLTLRSVIVNHLPVLLNFLCNMDDEAQATQKQVLQRLFHYITLFVGILVTGTTSLLLSESLNVPQAYHTSILTDKGWVRELLAGHLECSCELRVHNHVFLELIEELHCLGHGRSKYVSIEEQLVIFLYICVDEPHGSLFVYFRIFAPLTYDHVIVSHVTGIT
jgi:hypothetical protein